MLGNLLLVQPMLMGSFHPFAMQGPPDLGHRLPKPDAIGAWHMQLVAASSVLGSGDEITISYGPHSSLSFLLNFGFLPDYNPGAKALLYSSLQVKAMSSLPRTVQCSHLVSLAYGLV